MELGDLHIQTRHLMERMEANLGTDLDWVAVDHWNIDNPHTHTFLNSGTLSVSQDSNLGAATGTLNFSGGTLRITSTAYNSTAHPVNWGAGGGAFDVTDTGNTFTLDQALGVGRFD